MMYNMVYLKKILLDFNYLYLDTILPYYYDYYYLFLCKNEKLSYLLI